MTASAPGPGRPNAIPLELDTDDLLVAFDLLSSNTSLQPGVELAAPGGAGVTFRSRVGKGPRAPAGRMAFELVRVTPANTDRVAEWLERCLRSRLPAIRLGRATVPVELAALRQALSRVASE